MNILLYQLLVLAAFKVHRQYVIWRSVRSFVKDSNIEVVRQDPSIKMVDSFLTENEIHRIKKLASSKLRKSRVLSPTSEQRKQSSIRTSSTAFLAGFKLDPIIPIIKSKAAQLTGSPVSHIEIIQVVRYQDGEHYGPHFDAMDFAKYPGEARKGQRIFTVLVYLNGMENESGQTIFPQLGLKIKPRQGSALFFHNTRPDGAIDKRTLHAGAPLTGPGMEKWAMNIWVRDKALPLQHR